MHMCMYTSVMYILILKRYLQLNDTIVQRGADPGTDGVKGEALDTRRLAFKFGQHDVLHSQQLLQ